MIISAAQFNPVDGDITENLRKHIRLVELAVQQRSSLVLFPELSLTGYVRETAQSLAFNKNDKRIDSLQRLSDDHGIVIVVGAPISMNSKLYIGSFVIMPHKKVQIYTKQYLHDGEEHFYHGSFQYNPQIQVTDNNCSLAICADIENSKHAAEACKCGSNIYLASIFYSLGGIDDGCEKLKAYANKYNMAVLVSNFCGQSYGYKAGGKSSFWDASGNCIGALSECEEGLLVVEKTTKHWRLLNS